jgi:hypothetical protein
VFHGGRDFVGQRDWKWERSSKFDLGEQHVHRLIQGKPKLTEDFLNSRFAAGIDPSPQNDLFSHDKGIRGYRRR